MKTKNNEDEILFKKKEIISDMWKNAGLMVIVAVMIYFLGPSWKLFLNSGMLDKMFYVLFSIVFVYNGLAIIKKLVQLKDPMRARKPIIQLFKKSTEPNKLEPKPEVPEPEVSTENVFEMLTKSADTKVTADPKLMGEKMIAQMHDKVENFEKDLNEETKSLEKQFEHMNKLRTDINENVAKMHVEYKKLEEQMHITGNMIKTRKLLHDEIKQLK